MCFIVVIKVCGCVKKYKGKNRSYPTTKMSVLVVENDALAAHVALLPFAFVDLFLLPFVLAVAVFQALFVLADV